MALSAVSRGVVIDLEGELIPHPNGSKWLRVLVSRATAKDLWSQLLHVADEEEE
ncbi:Uncharacterised protein [Mycobacteroides abscessus subsp. massiliense]|nr:hypothetical protein PROPHIT493_9 [Mycobacterium phage prophiT49-3]SKM98932.1 Uncharacterised protein [Mycobacteroides abscessus subsp. massiliense]